MELSFLFLRQSGALDTNLASPFPLIFSGTCAKHGQNSSSSFSSQTDLLYQFTIIILTCLNSNNRHKKTQAEISTTCLKKEASFKKNIVLSQFKEGIFLKNLYEDCCSQPGQLKVRYTLWQNFKGAGKILIPTCGSYMQPTLPPTVGWKHGLSSQIYLLSLKFFSFQKKKFLERATCHMLTVIYS